MFLMILIVIVLTQGIHHEYTVPYSPQQNGGAERKNRTILNAIRCMLIKSGLSRGFWPEAVLTAVYIQNHLPTTAPSGKIPFTAWTAYGRILVYGGC